MMQSCWERIAEASGAHKSRICVGLDTDLAKLPEPLRHEKDPVYRFNCEVIEATIDLVCCYKPNMAFYEAMGAAGLDALARTIKYIRGRVPVVLDAKRGDIGNTAKKYAQAAFEWLRADAVTVNPYMGFDSVGPFMEYPGKGIFVLCLTSNQGAGDFQTAPQEAPLYERVARKVLEWDNGRYCLGLVVGATHPDRVERLRAVAGELPFLLPGIGAQGGSVECVEAAELAGEKTGVVVNASRSIIYAGSGKDFALDVRAAADSLRSLVGAPG
ncbi:MAG: orotidine-5'-phosphate decarboxylase [Gemmatimonadota bacterium]|nr:orotidine-5'-phosphate decarboxylase [Gemmatimonadota bacterium]